MVNFEHYVGLRPDILNLSSQERRYHGRPSIGTRAIVHTLWQAYLS